MATVYLARDLKHARAVAIKVLRPELAEVLGHERFLREIQISANLVHPHILPLHDSGEAGGLVYYVMPYIPGESLRARLDREEQLPLEDALKIGMQILSALNHAHSHGIVHRDVKPENVLLSAGEAVVADFGIARAIGAAGEGRITQAGMSLGTPGYMSPEQAGGKDEVDARSDVYAVACLIYEMLAGEPPFTGPIENVIQQHISADPPSVAARRRTVTQELDSAIKKALEKAPADRFATAGQFADAIEAATAKAPVVIEQVTRPGRRFRAGLLAGGVVAVAAIAGSAVMLSSPGAVPFEERDWLLITSFENLTGDSVFDRSLDAALASSISQSKRVNVFPQARVAEALVRMQRTGAKLVDQPTGIEIALREGLKAVLVPSRLAARTRSTRAATFTLSRA
jgi:serine/threonine-protein kinase